MENAENSFIIGVLRPVNLPLWWVSDEMARRIDDNTKMGLITDDHDLRDTIVKVRRHEIIYRATESVKRQQGRRRRFVSPHFWAEQMF